MEPERGSVRPFAIFFQTIITMVTIGLLEEKAFYKGWGGGRILSRTALKDFYEAFKSFLPRR